ncbi:MAG TPA: MBL fold metallo-hydrolase [Solirubrobacterales bacterium]|jgi:ribonuclease J
MRARIHRGATEVGGSCVELEAATGERLVLDLGLPLWAQPDEEVPLPSVSGLRDGNDSSLLGVLLSHAHPDHYGLIGSISADVPIYMGAATSRILKEASFFTPMGLDCELAGTLADRQSLQLGSFTVTPFLVDHSAFDAYALLVEANDRRLFYSGDLRAHGRKAGTFNRLVNRPPEGVNTLVLEGTTVGRKPDGASAPKDEKGVEERCVKLFRDTAGMALVCYSPQNIDRLVSVFRAAVRSGRDLVLDLYGAAVVAATGRDSIPQADWERIRVYVPQSQRVRVKEAKEFWRVNDLGASRIYTEELSHDPSRWVMSFRSSMTWELERAGCLQGAWALWSMWPGYLDGKLGEQTRQDLEDLGIGLTVVHASGHASVKDLQRFAAAINANKVVPIHTDAPRRFTSIFKHVEAHPNGEWWEI